jgi:hypothetical protein
MIAGSIILHVPACGVIDIAKSGDFVVQYLHIFEGEFKKAVAHESGAQEG